MTLGWILGKPLSLLFDPFESIVLFLSGALNVQLTDAHTPGPILTSLPAVLVVNYVVQDGKR